MTLTYVVIIGVLIALLYGSFRALAGGEVVGAHDVGVVLRRAAASAREQAAILDAALSDDAARGASPGDGDGRLTETVTQARKVLAGHLQQLAALPALGDGSDDDAERLDAARAALRTGLEDWAWACRLLEADASHGNAGMMAAVRTLREHGDALVALAEDLLAGAQPASA